MDQFATPLVSTKVRAPAPRPRSIARPRLIDLLAADDGNRLILVCAPAGYGKTTLLAEWAQTLVAEKCAVAWLALDEDDNDPVSFGSYLTMSFLQAFGPLPELMRMAQLLRASPEIELQRILPGLINAIAADGRKCVLILDDYHLIGSAAIHTALVYLLEHRPENLRVAVGSRSDPPLPLARMRARGQLREVRTANLRFTRAEAGQFLNEVMLLDLPAAGVQLLEERTEGWVAGLQLAGLSLAGRADTADAPAAFSGEQRYVVAYLMEEVISRQPEEIQAFLLATCVLERMRGDLCDAVSGAAESGESTLRRLEQSNLFVVALDDRGEWFRYHHLFREFLLNRLNKSGAERMRGLRRSACETLASKGLLREAARQAFSSADWEYAAAFVEAHSFSLIIHSDIATIYEWCAAFPETVLQQHPMLCILQSLALAYGFRRQNRERVEARLAQAERLIAGMTDREAADGLLPLVAVTRTFQAFAPDPTANPEDLLALSQRMNSPYPAGDAGQFSGLLVAGYGYLALQDARAAEEILQAARRIAREAQLYFGMVETAFHLAMLKLAGGKLREGAEICQGARTEILAALAPLGGPEQSLPALGSLDVLLGSVWLEQGRVDDGEVLLQRGLDQMGGGMNPYYLMAAYSALYRLYEIRQQTDKAREQMQRLEALWPDVSFYTRGLNARLALRVSPQDAHARAQAAAWSRQFAQSIDTGIAPGMGPYGAAEATFAAGVAWAEIEIELGNPRAALAFIDRQIERAAANQLDGRVIELSILEALGRQACGDEQAAVTALQRALDLAAPEGYVHSFHRGPAVARLLQIAGQRGVSTEYVQRIRVAAGAAAVDGQPGEAAPRSSPGEILSERELEVLRLIAGGASNQEAASRLVITVGTVKSHMNHILTKLDARNRTEAVARARALGWLAAILGVVLR